MTNIIENKIKNSYQYPSKGKGQTGLVVGFFLDSRKDKYDNVLKHINICNKYGELEKIPYSGSTLMISIQTSSKTTVIRKVTELDLTGPYKEAYKAFLSSLTSVAEMKSFEEELYLYLEQSPPIKKEELKKVSAPKKDADEVKTKE